MKTLLITFLLWLLAASFSINPEYLPLQAAMHDSDYARLTPAERRLPENALAGLDLANGLHATLFASEPMIGNPTNIDVDSRGRVWMCEAFNYRPALNPEHPVKAAGDRIVILEDIDGDGRADTSKVFYQGTDVNAALGIAVLGNKVIVSCSPNVFMFTDEDGDDVADKKELLFTHVGGEQHDHAVHAFAFGADGKLYFTFGNEGAQLMDKNGKIIVSRDGYAVTNKGEPYRQGMVFRMNVDGSDLEVLAHNFRNNYEAATDAFGTIWQSDNDDDGNQSTRINYVMQYGNYGYTDEKTGAGWRAGRINKEDKIPQQHWHQNDPGSIPNLLITGAGSPAGLCVYEGDLLPEPYRNQLIHCEAGNNVLQAYPVTADGAGFTASIKPLLTGTRDQWFRPVDVCTAPDGSLMVADWYDPGVGGHQMADMNRGRIYRITTPQAKSYHIKKPDLANPQEAVKALINPNIATRYLAWQQLAQWGSAAEPALQQLWQSSNVRNRARAFWLLARLPGSQNKYLQQALTDANKDIRITGLRAATQLATNVIPYVKMVVNDADPQVRREAALSLHLVKNAEAAALWAQLAQQYDGKDRWYLEALGIGADQQWDTFLPVWLKSISTPLNQAQWDIVWRARSGLALPLLANFITNENISTAQRKQFFRSFHFIDDPAKNNVLLSLLDYDGPSKNQVSLYALTTLDIKDTEQTPKINNALNRLLPTLKNTQAYVDLVRRYKLKSQNNALLQMALSMPDSSLGGDAAGVLINQGGAGLLKNVITGKDTARALAAIKTVGKSGSKEAVEMLQALIKDPMVKTGLRKRAINIMASKWNESALLLTMMKNNQVPKELQATAVTALSRSYRKDVRNGALAFMQVKTAKGMALPSINTLATLQGNALAGKKTFLNYCGVCHQVGNEGSGFGPALSQIGNKLTKEAIYVSIIHPDAGISFGYEGHVLEMKDGSTIAGIVSSETADAIEMVMPGGIKNRIEKAQVKSRKQMEHSMMPSGLHQAMTQQELVNLVEYLAALKVKRTE